MRVRKKAWTVAEYENNPHLVHNPQDYKGKWKELFGNDNPIYLEIGCGKGRFISQNALLNPDINFIGVERQSTIAATAARNVGSAKNVFLIHGDVENLLDFFEPGEIKRLYINFCDPWPKKKWYKRRLTYRDFLEKYKLLFGESGEIFFKTDNTILFEFSPTIPKNRLVASFSLYSLMYCIILFCSNAVREMNREYCRLT